MVGALVGVEATTFDVGFLTDPVGPKALPFLVAGMLLVSGVGTFVHPAPAGHAPGHPAALRMAAAVVAFLLYAVALPWLGFFLSTSLVVATLGFLFGGRPAQSCAFAVLLSTVLWLLFGSALALPLPIGDLWVR